MPPCMQRGNTAAASACPQRRPHALIVSSLGLLSSWMPLDRVVMAASMGPQRRRAGAAATRRAAVQGRLRGRRRAGGWGEAGAVWAIEGRPTAALQLSPSCRRAQVSARRQAHRSAPPERNTGAGGGLHAGGAGPKASLRQGSDRERSEELCKWPGWTQSEAGSSSSSRRGLLSVPRFIPASVHRCQAPQQQLWTPLPPPLRSPRSACRLPGLQAPPRLWQLREEPMSPMPAPRQG